MKRELDEKLCQDFPLLFGDRRKSMQETCMCWGFSCGKGWEPLIRRLAEKLEPLIQQWIDDNPFVDCSCGCPKDKHVGPKCFTIYKRPRWYRVWRSPYSFPSYQLKEKLPVFVGKLLIKVYRKVIHPFLSKKDKLMRWLCDKRWIYREDSCKCKGYHPQHPRASQVKEKFGTLRFYMDYANEEMWAHVAQAEKESEVTCEDCGAPGDRRGGGWIRTLCASCEDEYEKTRHRNRDA